MNYAGLNATIMPQVMQALALINNPEVDPEVRQLNQEILFREVGSAVYSKVYNMNAFDMEIEHTEGPGIDNRHYGLAKVASGSVSNGSVDMDLLVKNYLDSMAAKAQHDAYKNARQSGKHPTMVRSLVGSKNCSWCIGKAGKYVDPPAEAFHRHRGCDCKIETHGYRSRNGELDNYVKDKKS